MPCLMKRGGICAHWTNVVRVGISMTTSCTGVNVFLDTARENRCQVTETGIQFNDYNLPDLLPWNDLVKSSTVNGFAETVDQVGTHHLWIVGIF